jgi:hypothetical protein
LTTTHTRCPFLTVKPAAEEGVLAQARTWWRIVSPARQALVGFQLGLRAELGLSVSQYVKLAAVSARAWLVQTCAAVAQRGRRPVQLRSAAAETPPIEAVVAPDAHGPALLPRVAAQENDLVERGIAAVEAGDEGLGYRLFRKATEVDRRAIRAWFWRAKTAQTLDEVVACLRCALELDPANEQIQANLLSAQQRREPPAGSAATAPSATPVLLKMPRSASPRLAHTALRWCVELARTATAMAAFVVAAAWLLSALPDELRSAILASGGLTTLPVPDASMLSGLVHMTLAGGYEVGSALPYVLGFLGLFVGIGLLSGDGWTRLWAPALGIASAWLWTGATGAALSPVLLPACGAVALGGVLSLRRY